MPRRIDVGLRHLAGSTIAFDVRGDVPNILATDFSALAGTVLRSALSRHRLTGRIQPVLSAELAPRPTTARTTSLGSVYAVDSAPRGAHEPRRWPWRRVGLGVVAGLALGVVGLPRIESLSVALPPSGSPRVTSTSPPPSALTSYVTTFEQPLPSWPNDPRGSAWFSPGAYHLFARDAGRYIAAAVPMASAIADATLEAQFQKVRGANGGGYGFVVRSAWPDENFVVAELSDDGYVGIWQRDAERWVDILPWTPTSAALPSAQPNTVGLLVRRTTLQMSVNGQAVAHVTASAMAPSGGVGIFTGGDQSEVVVRSLRVDPLAP